MKLFATVATLALGLEIEQGGSWGTTECVNGNLLAFTISSIPSFLANEFKIAKLGNMTNIVTLDQFNAEEPSKGYKLEGNTVEILADKKDRELMGKLICRYKLTLPKQTNN